MNKHVIAGLLIILLLMLASCAAGPNSMKNNPSTDGKIAGFWQGLWHGFIAFFAFIISLFKSTISIYEVHNNGAWYHFGYILGVSIFFGGGKSGADKVRKCK